MSKNVILWEKILKKLRWDKLFKYLKLTNGEERRNDEIWFPCPFHGEDTPSFSISKTKGAYHCFGCKESGNLITLIAKEKEMDNEEAFEKLKALAGMSDYHVSIPDLREMLERLKLPKFKRLDRDIEANDFPETVRLDERAFTFLKKRHISRSTAIEYGIRLCVEGYYKDYIIIPIKDSSGRNVTFEARYVGSAGKKKVLYPTDSPDKLCVFNLSIARRSSSAILVEGIMDALSMISRGILNVVTCFGTSISDEQLRIITKHFDEVIIFLDNDEAGHIGNVKLKELLSPFVSVKVARSYEKEDIKYLGISYINSALSQAKADEMKKALFPLRKRLASLNGVLT